MKDFYRKTNLFTLVFLLGLVLCSGFLFLSGINVWRAEGFRQLNDDLIPALGSPAGGSGYDFLDEGLLNGRRYFYLLEDVDDDGIGTFHGPVKTVPRKR
ncbi:hypothetical protein ACFL43_06890 [Thermodesulfobacteriota bacterium]